MAEDNGQVRSLLAGALDSLGYHVEEVAGGDEAVEAFERLSECVQFLILDVDLPGRSGIDFLRRIRAQGHEVPAVLISGRVDMDIDRTGLGKVRFLPKPFTIPELSVALEHYV